MFKRIVLVLLAAVTLAGCVTHSQVFVGAGGNSMICQASGYGIIGATQAGGIQRSCEESMRSTGMLPVEEAGAIGVQISTELMVLTVSAKGPALTAGVLPGWKLTGVNGQPIHTREDASLMMFGKAGEPVVLEFSVKGEAREVAIIRATWPEVYGTGEATEPEEEIDTSPGAPRP